MLLCEGRLLTFNSKRVCRCPNTYVEQISGVGSGARALVETPWRSLAETAIAECKSKKASVSESAPATDPQHALQLLQKWLFLLDSPDDNKKGPGSKHMRIQYAKADFVSELPHANTLVLTRVLEEYCGSHRVRDEPEIVIAIKKKLCRKGVMGRVWNHEGSESLLNTGSTLVLLARLFAFCFMEEDQITRMVADAVHWETELKGSKTAV
ncbi:MAG: hypothetical protein Q9218_005810 [Villophora microphyllina]